MINNNKGFTLIELIIVISLFGIILLMTGSILNYNISKYKDESVYNECKINARYAMNRITNEIKTNYGTYYSLNRIMSSSSTILVNSVKNDMRGNIRYYYDPNRFGTGDGYGEFRGPNGEVIAKYIKDFTIEGIDTNLVKVTVKGGKQNNKRMFEISTYIKLYD